MWVAKLKSVQQFGEALHIEVNYYNKLGNETVIVGHDIKSKEDLDKIITDNLAKYNNEEIAVLKTLLVDVIDKEYKPDSKG